MELSRKEVIEELERFRLDSVYKSNKEKKIDICLDYAIKSLKTDEMYQLDYEGVQNIVVTEGMTNGDVIKLMFPNAEYKDRCNISITKRNPKHIGLQFTGMADKEWWNSPYKGVK